MTWQVLCVASPGTVPNSDLSIEAAELAGLDAEVVLQLCASEAEVAAAGATADGLLTLGVGLGRQTLSTLSRCRAIISISHGFNHLDLETATEMGIPVSNTYFCHEDVANHTLMLLLACARKLTILAAEPLRFRFVARAVVRCDASSDRRSGAARNAAERVSAEYRARRSRR